MGPVREVQGSYFHVVTAGGKRSNPQVSMMQSDPFCRRASDRKVLMGMASAATAASWNTLNRTSSRNGTMPRPRYSTCFGGEGAASAAPPDPAALPNLLSVCFLGGDGAASAAPPELTASAPLAGGCFRPTPPAALEAGAALGWLAVALLPALLLQNVAVLSCPTVALQSAAMKAVSALGWALRATLTADDIDEMWPMLPMLPAAATDARGRPRMVRSSLDAAWLTGCCCCAIAGCKCSRAAIWRGAVGSVF